MKTFLYAYLLLVLVPFTTCCSRVGFFASEAKMRRNSYTSVVLLKSEFTRKKPNGKEETLGMSATGFVIDKDHIITAGHYCMESVKLLLTTENLIKAQMIGYVLDVKEDKYVKIEGLKPSTVDTVNDLCMITKINHGLVPVVLSDRTEFKTRDKVYTIGAPKGVFPIETEGYIAVPFFEVEDDESALNKKIMCSMRITKGNSGSPLFDERGEVIGVIVMTHPEYDQVSFATNVKELKAFIEETKKIKKNEQ